MLDLDGKRLHQNVRHPISRFYTYGNLNSISNSQSSCTRPITNFAPVLNPMTDMPVILHLPLSLALGLAFFLVCPDRRRPLIFYSAQAGRR